MSRLDPSWAPSFLAWPLALLRSMRRHGTTSVPKPLMSTAKITKRVCILFFTFYRFIGVTFIGTCPGLCLPFNMFSRCLDKQKKENNKPCFTIYS